MEFDRITAGIQLIGSTIKKLKVENSITDLNMSAKKSFGIVIKEPKVWSEEESLYSTAEIILKVEIDQGDGQTLKLDMNVEGAFLALDKTEENAFKKLVAINGVSALIGIARGKIEAVSASILNSGKIVIPFVNVIEYYKECNKQE